MWSDKDIDNAFQRLNPPEPEPAPFPLDAWLQLEAELDKAAVERTVRQRLWKFFAAEVALVFLIALGWLAWPTAPAHTAARGQQQAASAKGPRAMQDAASATSAAGESPSAAIALAASRAWPVAPAPAAAGSASSASEPAPPAAGRRAAVRAAGGTAPEAAPRLPAPARPRPTRRYLGVAGPALARPARPLELPTARSSYRREAAAAAQPLTGPQVAGQSALAAGAGRHLAAGSTTKAETRPAAAVAAAPAPTQASAVGQSPLPASAAARATQAQRPTDLAASAAAVGSPQALVPAVAHLRLPAPPEVPTALAALPAAPADLPAPVRQPRWYVGLVAAPDVSTVRFAGVEKPMPNVGLTLEYRFSNRLRVRTGLLRATKSYMARRSDYDWGAYSAQVYAHDFADVDGDCTVLDVPLDLRCTLLQGPQHQLFASAGLSSFFMQREHYYYSWTDASGFHAWNGYAVNQNQHLLSILNLSVGYEHRLGSHWSVQAEPYAKLPLAGVGLGKVRLASAGIFFGLKYGF